MSTGARRLRALVLPLLLVVVAVYAVQTAARTPSEPAPDAAASPDPLPLPEPLGALWAAWSEDLADGGGYPVELASLDRSEALYVLLSVRAAQVAEAVAQAGPQAEVAEALDAAGLSPQPELVPAARVAEQPGCVVLTLDDEPFGRSYFGWAAAPSEPGPSPVSELEGLLLRIARVGLESTDAATCGGGGVAYSLPAQEALRELSPTLLTS